MRHRPIRQPNAPRGIDRRTWTRYATEVDRELAGRALHELELERLVVKLAPAPQAHFDGHKVRVVESRNPEWYRSFVEDRRFQVKRTRVTRALERVFKRGRVRGNGYERDLLKALGEFYG